MSTPLHTRKVKADEVRHALEVAIGSDGVQVICLDSEYKVVPEAEMMDVVRATRTSVEQYVPEYHDCDSFARELWARIPNQSGLNSVAMVIDFSGKHAYNAIVVAKGESDVAVKFVEPQADAEFKLHSQPCYILSNGLVLI